MKIEVLGNTLDQEQTKAALTSDKNTMIIAGAGAGKSLTMVGKIKYLVENKRVPLENILCITFTNNAAKSLEEKIKKELKQENKVYTFHKLSLEILKNNHISYKITTEDLLDYLIEEIFFGIGLEPYFTKLFFHKDYFQRKEFIQYKKTIAKFIRLYIANYYDIKYFDIIIAQAQKKDIPYLLIMKKIYEMYLLEKKSQGFIDFDDMIALATKVVHNHGKIPKYQYIIIDEYQDTSLLRENLVKEIQMKTNAYITVVGDDFQSIYRFSGCDLNNFLDFPNHFKPVEKIFITNTYRNSQELIHIAGSFIMKNKKQIEKNLKSSKHIVKPIIICYYKDIKKDFCKLLQMINSNNIMILGRNNLDIYDCLDKHLSITNNTISFFHKNIYYKTIHKAKGLEEENVIVINLTNQKSSLPSKIKEEQILKYITKVDSYPYEEERRLFYVALTRTKNYCYLFVDKKKPSIFVEELRKEYKKDIQIKYL